MYLFNNTNIQKVLWLKSLCIRIVDHKEFNKTKIFSSSSNYEYDTRQSNDFYTICARTNATHNSPYYLGLRIFNKLLNSFKCISRI